MNFLISTAVYRAGKNFNCMFDVERSMFDVFSLGKTQLKRLGLFFEGYETNLNSSGLILTSHNCCTEILNRLCGKA